MSLPSIINIRTSETANKGFLSVFETEIDVDFPIKRFYYIHNVPVGIKRGGHAHKSLSEILFCPFGSVSVYLNNGIEQCNLLLNSPEKAVMIPPGIWIEMTWVDKKSVLCAAASEHYDLNECIYSVSEFNAWVQKKKIL